MSVDVLKGHRERRWSASVAVVSSLVVDILLWLASGIAVPAVLALPAARLQALVTIFLGIVIEALPFLLAGVLVSSAIHLFVTPDQIARYLPRHPVAAALTGSLTGLAFPVCECGSIPTARRLMQKGAPVPLGIAFVLAAPVVNPIVIISTWVAFSAQPAIVAWRVGLTILIATVTALVVGLHPRAQSLLSPVVYGRPRTTDHGPPTADHHDHDRRPSTIDHRPSTIDHHNHDHGPRTTDHGPQFALSGAEGTIDQHRIQAGSPRPPSSIVHDHDHDHDHSHLEGRSKLGALLGHASGELFEMGRYLVIGALIAAALQSFVPRQALLAVGQEPVLGVLALMGLAMVLSICSTVDAFVALSFANSFLPGALIAFLVFGPMIDIKSVLMLGTTFRRRTVLLLVLLPAQLSLLAGVLINYYL